VPLPLVAIEFHNKRRWQIFAAALPWAGGGDEIAGIEGAYVDVFVAVSADSDGGGRYDLRLSQQDVCALQRIGLPVEFTLDVAKD
jgi:hypothetical protein